MSTATPDPVLSIRNLRYTRGEHSLFNRLDLDVYPGEVVVLLGKSGSGKSSLLNLIFDSSNKTHTGTIRFDRDHSAYLTQDGALFDHLSVLNNLRLVQAFAGHSNTDQAREILSALNIPDGHHDRLPGTLSGGERRRVAVARALVKAPGLLCFDEPETGLDIANLHDLGGLVRSEADDHGRGILVVTHNPLLAALIADRVLILEDGRLGQWQSWNFESPAERAEAVNEHRQALEACILGLEHLTHSAPVVKAPRFETLRTMTHGLLTTLFDLPPLTPSFMDYLHILGRTLHLAFFSGLLFFLMVGAVLGATSIAIVGILTEFETVRDLTLSHLGLPGFVENMIRDSDYRIDLRYMALQTLKASHIIVLAPALAAILYLARSGTIVTAWLGGISLSGQVRAMQGLGISPTAYLNRPVLMGAMLSYALTVLTVTTGMWLGGYFIATYGFGIQNAEHLLVLDPSVIRQSFYFLKVLLYGYLISALCISFGMATKYNHDHIARHSTQATIHATTLVAISELLFAFTLGDAM